jgi:hypothetical protein
VAEAVDEGNICAGFVAQMQGGKFGNIDFARVSHNQFCAALSHRLAQHRAEDGVLFGGVRTDEESLLLKGYDKYYLSKQIK